MGKKISLFSECGACRASLSQVQLRPFLSRERAVHVLSPLPAGKCVQFSRALKRPLAF